MAYITGEFEYKQKYKSNDGIVVQVLQPTKDEIDFKDGMNIQCNWDSFMEVKPDELKKIGQWLIDTADFVEKNFDKKGKRK